jgi:hypothetical protein
MIDEYGDLALRDKRYQGEEEDDEGI